MMFEFPYKIEQCVWELTRRDAGLGRPRPMATVAVGPQDELTLRECLGIAGQLIEQDCQHVTLTGREVFQYAGWDRIARRLNDGGVHVSVVTDGFVAGPKQIAQLQRARLACIHVAIDGLAPSHERVRGLAGSFARAVNLLGTLMSEGFAVTVVTNVTEFNFADLPALYDLLLKLGVTTWQIQLASPARGRTARTDPMLNPRRVAKLTRFIADRNAEGKMAVRAGDEIGYFDPHEPLLRHSPDEIAVWQGCQAGLKSVSIDCCGNVRGCQTLNAPKFLEGNLRTQTLSEIWRRPGAFAYNRKFHPRRLQGRCASCDLGNICRAGCRSICYLTTGRLYENPYCCHRAAPMPVRLAPKRKTRQAQPNA